MNGSQMEQVFHVIDRNLQRSSEILISQHAVSISQKQMKSPQERMLALATTR